MKKRLEKPPKYIYSIFGETGEKPDVWYVESFSEEPAAIKAVNTLNSTLKLYECHTDNWNPVGSGKALHLVKTVDEAARIEFPGSRYSMIKYKYEEAEKLGRLPGKKKVATK